MEFRIFKWSFEYVVDINSQYQSLFRTKTDEDPVTVRGTYALILKSATPQVETLWSWHLLHPSDDPKPMSPTNKKITKK
jgi:hypothetical protein